MVDPISGRLRVLICDDDADTRDTTAVLLKHLDCDVAAARDAAEAAALATTFHPQLVLLDVRMPRTNGITLANMLRSADLPAFKLVAVSGANDTREQCVQAGFDEFLLKPTSLDTLRDIVERTRGAVTPAFHSETAPAPQRGANAVS